MQLRRWFFLVFLIFGLLGNYPLPAQSEDSTELMKTADDVVQTVVRLRGLDFKTPVRKGVKTREEIESYINEEARKRYRDEDLDKEGKMLQKLGLIPEEINYREYLIKLLTEQVGGFYDPETKTLYIASWISPELQKPVMVHELTHALQDQYFDIEKIMDKDRTADNDDRTMAHMALIEGDAIVVMLQQQLEPLKRHFSELPDLSFVMQAQMETMQAQFPVFRDAPMYIQQSLIFPYGYGASFLQNAWKRNPGWESVNRMYSDLPASTEQIMHPEKYFGVRDNPEPVTSLDPTVRLGSDWRISYRNVMGEFSLGLFLNLQLTEEHAQKAVTGWGGDRVLYLENTAGDDAVFIDTVWDTEEDAEKFFLAMDEWFKKRFPNAKRENVSPASFSLIQDKEFFELQREGKNLHVVVGLPETFSRRWLQR